MNEVIHLGRNSVQDILSGKQEIPEDLTFNKIICLGKSAGKTTLHAAIMFMYLKKKCPEEMKDVTFDMFFYGRNKT